MVTINETEVKKDLFKSKTMARFSHYMAGNLYYHVDLVDGTYQFPISTIEDNENELGVKVGLKLSDDLGTTSFYAEIRGSELARWISKAMKNETFIKLG